jgi:hypothetical protein
MMEAQTARNAAVRMVETAGQTSTPVVVGSTEPGAQHAGDAREDLHQQVSNFLNSLPFLANAFTLALDSRACFVHT